MLNAPRPLMARIRVFERIVEPLMCFDVVRLVICFRWHMNVVSDGNLRMTEQADAPAEAGSSQKNGGDRFCGTRPTTPSTMDYGRRLLNRGWLSIEF